MRLNDKQLRASFLLLQKMTRENEKSTERVEQLEEARGFDRELMMAMTFHEVLPAARWLLVHRFARPSIASLLQALLTPLTAC